MNITDNYTYSNLHTQLNGPQPYLEDAHMMDYIEYNRVTQCV